MHPRQRNHKGPRKFCPCLRKRIVCNNRCWRVGQRVSCAWHRGLCEHLKNLRYPQILARLSASLVNMSSWHFHCLGLLRLSMLHINFLHQMFFLWKKIFALGAFSRAMKHLTVAQLLEQLQAIVSELTIRIALRSAWWQ